MTFTVIVFVAFRPLVSVTVTALVRLPSVVNLCASVECDPAFAALIVQAQVAMLAPVFFVELVADVQCPVVLILIVVGPVSTAVGFAPTVIVTDFVPFWAWLSVTVRVTL